MILCSTEVRSKLERAFRFVSLAQQENVGAALDLVGP